MNRYVNFFTRLNIYKFVHNIVHLWNVLNPSRQLAPPKWFDSKIRSRATTLNELTTQHERLYFARRVQRTKRDARATTCAAHLCTEGWIIRCLLHSAPRTLTPRCPVRRVDLLSVTLSSITFHTRLPLFFLSFFFFFLSLAKKHPTFLPS